MKEEKELGEKKPKTKSVRKKSVKNKIMIFKEIENDQKD